jgi:exopolysaccharide production protein ExoZ
MLKSLQAFRALAALMVLLYHAEHGIFRVAKYSGHEVIGRLVDFAPACLDFFFVLSGFIIMYAHSADIGRPSVLGTYFWRRFSRAYLFYWVVMACVVPALFIVPSIGFDYQRDPGVILRSVFLVPDPHFHMIIDVAWTMVYEVFFYLMFALLILNRRVGTIAIVGWIVGTFIHPWLGTSHGDFLFSPIHQRFAAGMLVCMAVQRWRIPAPRLIAGLGLGLFMVAGVVWSYCAPLDYWHHVTCFVLGSCLLIAGLTEADRSGLIGAPRSLVYLGDAAFAIYLVHFLALSVIAKISKSLLLDRYLPDPVLFGLYVLGALAVGCVCHHLIEHPLHVWSKRYFVRKKSCVDSSATVAAIRKAA